METEDKLNYWTYKERGICTRCKRTDTERKKDGTKYAWCKDCREIGRKEKAAWKAKHPEEWASQIRRRSKRARDKLKESGICARCHRREVTGTTTCDPCAIEIREYCNGRRKRTRILVCTLCKGKLGPPHRMRTACPLRFRVSVDEFATARSGPGDLDQGWKWEYKGRKGRKKDVQQFHSNREGSQVV